MKRLIYSISFFSLAILTLMLTACQQGGHEQHQQHKEPANPAIPQQISVSFQANPAQPAPGEPVTLNATVRAGEQPVDDAKVELEVWKKGEKDHHMLETQSKGQGVYSASATYQAEGEYLVIVHVTTPQVHQMIEGKFQVGEAKKEEHKHGQGHDHGDGLSMHVMLPKEVKSGQETKLTAHVRQEGNPFVDAEVQFEYWKEGDQKHEYTDTAEVKPGEYYTSIRFSQPGTYHLILHVEKGNIHDHKEQTLIVK